MALTACSSYPASNSVNIAWQADAARKINASEDLRNFTGISVQKLLKKHSKSIQQTAVAKHHKHT